MPEYGGSVSKRQNIQYLQVWADTNKDKDMKTSPLFELHIIFPTLWTSDKFPKYGKVGCENFQKSIDRSRSYLMGFMVPWAT